MNSLSIVIPVFNEKSFLETGLEPLIARALSIVPDLEVVVVDDGSGDSSKALLEELERGHPGLKVITHQKNLGYGAAVRTGLRNARKDWVLFMDGDGQMDIGDLGDFWESKDSLDFILGYREFRRDHFFRRLSGKAGNWLANLFLPGERIRDINCGFKLFKTGIIKDLPLYSLGGAIYFEMLLRLLPSDPAFAQRAVNHCPRTHGSATGGSWKTILGIAFDSAAAILWRKK